MTRIRQIIRYLHELQSGYDRTQNPLPKETVFLPVTEALSGRMQPFGMGHDEEDFSDLADLPWLWKPTEEPTPSRWYPARTKGHSRGTITHPFTRRAITFASTYEMNLAYMLSANRHISQVEDQPSSILVTRDDGEHKHTIDYRATLAGSGYRINIAVRPSWLIEKDNLDVTIARINAGSLDGCADEAVILTEREITNDRGWNAKSVLRALKASVEDDNNRLRDYAAKFQGAVSLADLQRVFECSAAAWNAAWCLVHAGVLLPARPDLKLVDAPFVTVDHSMI